MSGLSCEVAEAVDRFVRELRTRIPVDRVILFRSHAHGTAIDEAIMRWSLRLSAAMPGMIGAFSSILSLRHVSIRA